MGQPPQQRLWRQIDQLDPVGPPQHLIRYGLPLPHPRDPLDRVVQRCEVLDADGGDDVDPGVEDLGHVLPALGVARAGDVGVGQLVDQDDRGSARDDGTDVQLGERRPPVRQGPQGQDLQAVEEAGGGGTAVGLDEAHDDVLAPFAGAPRLAEHGVRLAHPGRDAQVDSQPPSGPASHSSRLSGPVERQG